MVLDGAIRVAAYFVLIFLGKKLLAQPDLHCGISGESSFELGSAKRDSPLCLTVFVGFSSLFLRAQKLLERFARDAQDGSRLSMGGIDLAKASDDSEGTLVWLQLWRPSARFF